MGKLGLRKHTSHKGRDWSGKGGLATVAANRPSNFSRALNPARTARANRARGQFPFSRLSFKVSNSGKSKLCKSVIRWLLRRAKRVSEGMFSLGTRDWACHPLALTGLTGSWVSTSPTRDHEESREEAPPLGQGVSIWRPRSVFPV